MLKIICGTCGRDINQIGQDNVSYTATPDLCAWCSDQENIDRQPTVHLTCPVCGKEVHQSGNLRTYRDPVSEDVVTTIQWDW